MTTSTQKTYIKGLHGLRALAALSVFGVHFNQIVQLDVLLGPFDLYKLLSNGEHAVPLFIILSGFLLSQPFWQAIIQKKPLPDFKNYALKRVARIVPAYYLALVLLVFMGNLWRMPGAWIDILLHSTFLFNFTEFTIMSINPPIWTLAVEVQLYILLPILFLVIRQLSVRQGVITITCLALAGYGLHYWLNHSITKIIAWPFQPWLTWIRPYGAVLSQSPLALLPHFLVGLLIGRLFLSIQAAAHEKQGESRFFYEPAFWFCFAFILILLSTGLGDALQLPYGRYGMPVVMFLLAFLILTAPMTTVAGYCLESVPLHWLGIISYGFYIYHYPCLQWCDRIMAGQGFDAQQHWFWFGMASLLTSILVATLSYFIIERPLLTLLSDRNKIPNEH